MELPKPNNTHSSEAAKRMEFAEGSDPELTTEEKIRAAKKFGDLVLSTFLRFAGDAKTYDHTVLEDGIKSSILLEIPQEDGSCVLVEVESATLDNGDEERYDDNLAEQPRELRGAPHPEESISIEGIKRALDMCRNEVENRKLEQQMGLNRQPVGVEEINKLAELLESAEPRK